MDRIRRETITVECMVRLYCRTRHWSKTGLCAECASLNNYAAGRLRKCRFGAGKPPCAKCPIHCYAPPEREALRRVMRFAGPRMIVYHPILALQHILDVVRNRGRIKR